MESETRSIDWRRFAPYGLYLAVAALLAAAGIYVVMREWNLYLQIALAVAVIGLASFILLDPDRMRSFFTGRQARYGSNAVLMAVAFIGIVVVVNFVAYKNPKRWDLTEDKTHTLADETINTLDVLPQPVKAIAFYPTGVSTDSAQQLLDDYKFHGKGKFDYEFIDPISNPVAANDAGVSLQSSGTIVLDMGGRKEKVAFASEEEMTGAMVRLMATEQSVYFLTGHGEYTPDSSGTENFALAMAALQAKRYTVSSLNLQATGEIPEDAAAIVIAGYSAPITDEEMGLLSEYARNGGNLFVMVEPSLVNGLDDSQDPMVSYLRDTWGIEAGNNIILDGTSENFLQVVAYQYASHPISEKVAQQNLNLVFPFARSVTNSEAVEGVTVTPLLLTHENSWAESDMAALSTFLQDGTNPPAPDGENDIFGPVPLAAAAENASSGARLVVIGDVHFALGENFNSYGNGDLLVNSIDWMTEQENLMSLTPKETTTRMMVTPNRYTLGLIVLASVCIVPGLVVAGGITAYIMRRRRG